MYVHTTYICVPVVLVLCVCVQVIMYVLLDLYTYPDGTCKLVSIKGCTGVVHVL